MAIAAQDASSHGLFAGGGDMGASMRSFHGSATPLARLKHGVRRCAGRFSPGIGPLLIQSNRRSFGHCLGQIRALQLAQVVAVRLPAEKGKQQDR